MKAVVTGSGTIRVEALRPVKVAADKQLDLWVWPHGDQSPTLLGSVAATGGSLRFTAGLVDGTPMMITLEPRDLPNTGQQGPTVFQGQLGLID
jgi:anti-sigma-K factor RskA